MTFKEVEQIIHASDINIVDTTGAVVERMPRGMVKDSRASRVEWYGRREVRYVQAVDYRTVEVGII